MKLIIFPGGSDPNHIKYNQVYTLITKEAKKLGYTEIYIPTYLGHKSHPQQGELTLKGAVETVRKTILSYEAKHEEYRVICRSFGCFPFIEVIKNVKTKYLEKAILWGIPPYYLYYKVTVTDFDKNYEYALEVGSNPSRELFTEIYPFELSISEIDIAFPLIVTSGSNDEYFPEHFRQSLLKLNKNTNINFPVTIKGLSHSVKEFNSEYIYLLLNKRGIGEE